MIKTIVAFDIDGTLITNQDPDREHGEVSSKEVPHEDIIATLKTFSRFKNIKIVVWSGGGKAYAESIGRRLELDKYVWRYYGKTQLPEVMALGYPIVAIDDIQDCTLGDINLIVRNK
jgi:hydroxymethylpyrimidine pyrophosphatase-like HAD family hydrolase